jgi:hypothetical protein
LAHERSSNETPGRGPPPSQAAQPAAASGPRGRSFAAPGPLPVVRELLTAGIELDLETEIERQLRMEALKEELARMLSAGDGAAVIDKTLSLVLGLERENERLAWRLLRAMRYRFGRSTEKLSREELAQLFLALGGTEAEAQAQTEAHGDLAIPAPPPRPDETNDAGLPPLPEKRKRKAGGGTRIGPDVERVITVVPIPADEQNCALCERAHVV